MTEQPCVMCSKPSSRGELVQLDSKTSEVGWCLDCWLRNFDETGPCLRLVERGEVA